MPNTQLASEKKVSREIKGCSYHYGKMLMDEIWLRIPRNGQIDVSMKSIDGHSFDITVSSDDIDPSAVEHAIRSADRLYNKRAFGRDALS